LLDIFNYNPSLRGEAFDYIKGYLLPNEIEN
jgi:hypothetical protein